LDHASLLSTQMTMLPAFRRILHRAGSGLSLLGIAFVAIRLKEYCGSQDLAVITPLAWVAIGGLAVICGLSNILLALSWQKLLEQFGVCATRMWSIRSYGISQLAKYVPGNILHIAGRQAIGMSAGISGGVIAKSIFLELVLIAVAGVLYGWLVLTRLVFGLPLIASIVIMLCTVWVIAYLLRRYYGLQAAEAFRLQMLFLAVSGGVFVTLFEIAAQCGVPQPENWIFIGGAYVVAWFLGFIAPGAPAGVGVRELTLLFLLKGILTDADLIVAVLLGRMVTLVGDVLFFCGSFFIPVKKVFVERICD